MLPASGGGTAEPVSETWYDLAGRVCHVRPEAKGVYVRRVEKKDGTHSVAKVYVDGDAARGL